MIDEKEIERLKVLAEWAEKQAIPMILAATALIEKQTGDFQVNACMCVELRKTVTDLLAKGIKLNG